VPEARPRAAIRGAGKWGRSLEIAKRNPTKILEEKEGWLKVITEQIGWVKKDFVSTV
jgi:hypothetical protein